VITGKKRLRPDEPQGWYEVVEPEMQAPPTKYYLPATQQYEEPVPPTQQYEEPPQGVEKWAIEDLPIPPPQLPPKKSKKKFPKIPNLPLAATEQVPIPSPVSSGKEEISEFMEEPIPEEILAQTPTEYEMMRLKESIKSNFMAEHMPTQAPPQIVNKIEQEAENYAESEIQRIMKEQKMLERSEILGGPFPRREKKRELSTQEELQRQAFEQEGLPLTHEEYLELFPRGKKFQKLKGQPEGRFMEEE
jgi:hypothetical protein